jgi:hypothetical protein
MKISNSIIIIILATCVISIKAECNTPAECYTKAKEALHQAREEHNATKEKLTALIDKVKIDIDDFTKIIGAQDDINTNFKNKINHIEQIFGRIGCRDAFTQCYDEDVDLFWLLKNNTALCNGYEHLMGWGFQSCESGQIRYYQDCCRHSHVTS